MGDVHENEAELSKISTRGSWNGVVLDIEIEGRCVDNTILKCSMVVSDYGNWFQGCSAILGLSRRFCHHSTI